ncbi:amidohydrolase family protein [Paenibacillus solisilvae]|uniref:Amidohydrolase family protein n=1 Tax=Paenibacillus solisilvae TaxID=2486751 RepID=A0ABW0W1G0_9BACL
MIVDAHSHLMWYPDHLDKRYAEAALASKLVKLKRSGGEAYQGKLDLHAYDSLPEEHWKASEPAGKVVVFGLQARHSGIWIPNEIIAHYRDEHPEKIEGWASVDPTQDGYLDEFYHCIETLKLTGLKLGPIYQNIHPQDPRMHPLYAVCQKLGMPIMFHQGTTFPRQAPLKYASPLQIEDIAIQYPELKMIIAHLGHPFEDETVAVIRKQPNVFTDISAVHYRPWRYWDSMVKAVEYGVENKILLASDFPSGTITNVINGLKNINKVVDGTPLPRISDEVIDMIMHENWKSIFPQWASSNKEV